MTVGFTRDAAGYLPIAAYGLIGDCRSAALVSVDGSIDWLCLPRFDDASVFARILDAQRGGHWQICPTEPFRASQRYRDLTNILDTVFATASGVVVLSDFMPVDEQGMLAHARLRAAPRLVRLVECIAGSVELRHVIAPAPDFGRAPVTIRAHNQHLHAETAGMQLVVTSSAEMTSADSTITLGVGETAAFALSAGRAGAKRTPRWSSDGARELARTTQEFWWRWIGQCTYDGPYQQHVWRSALVLKLMTYSPTGAIVAAPTTSLPEEVGGSRNWDYRYSWLRDASFTLYAFFQLGLTGEAEAFFHWLSHRHLAERHDGVPNLFDLDGQARIPEIELGDLDGYRHSRPVRVGNGAVHQLQLDVYGEILDSAYLYARFGGDISIDLWTELRAIVDLAIARWQEPDSSIWESRSQPMQYTYSKLMCWVAVDRGLRIAERYHLPHDAPGWKAARRAMHRRITSAGYSREREAFAQSLGGTALDAAMLRVSQVRFLPDRDPRILSTIRTIEEHLGEGVMVRRYHLAESDDGIDGGEGAFFLTSFWLVDALAHAGELEAAQRRFERLMALGSPLGLFSEEVDERSGELLGNFPQAFTHLGLIGAAVNIERARHGRIGLRGLRASTTRRPPRPASTA